MKKLSLLFLLVASCTRIGTPVEVRDAKDNFEVEKLFTVDGCSVYRFYSDGSKYFTNCSGSTQWAAQEGKVSVTKNISGGKR